MIELMIAMIVLTASVGMLTSTITATAMQSAEKSERALAVEAARGIIEDMHNQSFSELFALYNADPTDDPGGVGTAPGNVFNVTGLNVQATDQDGFVGEILLPSAAAPLLENAVDQDLGLPRDLNGDLVIDELDHAADYLILPLRIRVAWTGRAGPRELSMGTMMADIRKLR